jgi:hypothetical protein
MNSYSGLTSYSTTLIMKHILTLIAAFSLLAGLSPAAEPLNTVCPISGKPANPAITSAYSKTVAVCCDRCKAQFTAAPKATSATSSLQSPASAR